MIQPTYAHTPATCPSTTTWWKMRSARLRWARRIGCSQAANERANGQTPCKPVCHREAQWYRTGYLAERYAGEASQLEHEKNRRSFAAKNNDTNSISFIEGVTVAGQSLLHLVRPELRATKSKGDTGAPTSSSAQLAHL